MKELVVVSGKGGTGKTSLTAALANLAPARVLCDADVDAADLHLLMSPVIVERHDFKGGSVAVVDDQKCTQCGLCREMCRFGAVDEAFQIDDIACEGCGLCVDFCPTEAIAFPQKVCGEWFLSDTRFGPMVHARLGIAEENSGKLVTQVRQAAAKLAADQNIDLLITDGPPGVGCPVIASMGGAGAVVIVTEPTVSGLHDMQRVADLAQHFKVPRLVCVNKFDLNPEMTRVIERWAIQNEIPVLGRVPFDPVFTQAMVQAQTVIEFDGQGVAAQAMRDIWEKIEKFTHKEKQR